MRSIRQFAAFQLLWLAAVLGAARGFPSVGALALLPYLAWMLARERRRGRLAARWLAAGALGSLADCVLSGLGWLVYPTAPPGWPAWLVPPFIAGLWIAFATLPHVSLAWLAPRPALAALLGAVGGPLSFAAGVRAGAVAYGDSPVATNAVLALEYALATPLLCVWLARDPRTGGNARSGGVPHPPASLRRRSRSRCAAWSGPDSSSSSA